PAPDNAMNRVRREEAKGVLFLDGLRRKMGDDKFLALMKDFFAANASKEVTAQSFLDKAGVVFDFTEPPAGPMYLVDDIRSRLATAVIVYGTLREAGANRYTAEQMQSSFLNQFEHEVPIYKDFEASEELLKGRDVIYVGRPETNSALDWWTATKEKRVGYDAAMFNADGKTCASERCALIYAGASPANPHHMVLIVAGNDALRTVKAWNNSGTGRSDSVVWQDGVTPVEQPRGRRNR
ncbi:MAG TPA: hypothetical protein VGF59_30175, partial [Bryobacteraceae bacterium]